MIMLIGLLNVNYQSCRCEIKYATIIQHVYLQVHYFSSLNSNVSQICAKSVLKGGEKVTLPSSSWHGPLTLTTEFCRYLNMGLGTMRTTLISYVTSSGSQ